MEAAFFTTPGGFRAWLEVNHEEAPELLVGFHKAKSGMASMTWPESVDQALCFGWIDGIRRRIDDTSYSIRFTPRRQRSIWSAVNIDRSSSSSRRGSCTRPVDVRSNVGPRTAHASTRTNRRPNRALTRRSRSDSGPTATRGRTSALRAAPTVAPPPIG